jgi:hypothetical protein
MMVERGGPTPGWLPMFAGGEVMTDTPTWLAMVAILAAP